MPEITRVEPRVRIVSGEAAVVEHVVNALLDTYSPALWDISAAGELIVVTCVLVHQSEIRKQQLAQMHAAPVPALRVRQ